jgi:hypothetical protein
VGSWLARGGLGKKEILRRAAPQDDGQRRVGWEDFAARRSGAFAADGRVTRLNTENTEKGLRARRRSGALEGRIVARRNPHPSKTGKDGPPATEKALEDWVVEDGGAFGFG